MSATILSGAAAVVHALVAVPHLEEYAPFGVLFLTAAVAQAGWAALVAGAPSRRLLRIGVLLNAAIVAAWALSRTVGLPAGPERWSPEPVGAMDMAATGFELGVIVASAFLLTSGFLVRASRIDVRRVAVLATLGAAALTGAAFGGTQTAVARGAHDSAGHDAGAPAAHDDRSAVELQGRRSVATAAGPPPALVDPRRGGFEIALGEWTLAMEAKAIRPGLVTFVVTNRGRVVHGFEIEGADLDDDGGADDGDGPETETRRLRSGETVRLTLNLAPGRYKVECFVGDHDDMGMEAILDVRPDAPLVAPPAAKGTANVVGISGFAFRPSSLVVKAGTTVRWSNRDSAPHTVTAANGGFSSRSFGQGGGYSRKFARRGTYSYLCALHPQMRGKVSVR